jgi:ketosteroid isomerase-like protein
MALLIASALAVVLFQSSASPADTEELTRLERVWNQAHEKGNAKPLEQLWADDIEITVPKMAVMNREEALRFFRSGRMTFDRYETSDLEVRVYGDAAVVSGRLERSRSLLGVTTTDDWRFTKVYARQSGRWRVVAFHASDAPDR